MSFVDAHDFPVDLVLRVLCIPSSTYYGWRARATASRESALAVRESPIPRLVVALWDSA